MDPKGDCDLLDSIGSTQQIRNMDYCYGKWIHYFVEVVCHLGLNR
jgi:hypothetical protein